MAKVWGYVKTVLSIIGGIAIAIWAMRRTGLRRADAARGVVADIRSATDGVGRSIDGSRDAITGATDAVGQSASAIRRGTEIVDELDATIGRGQSILEDIRGQG